MIDPKIIIIIQELLQRSLRFIIAIDGRGGAGKSTFAKALKQEFSDIKIVEYDWFYQANSGNDLNKYDSERLYQQIISPYLNGEQILKFGKYNWGFLAEQEQEDLLTKHELILEEQSILLIEGCMTLHPHLSKFYDLKIWIDTSSEESFQRGVRRDIEEYHLLPETVKANWHHWSVSEQNALKSFDRKSLADFVIK